MMIKPLLINSRFPVKFGITHLPLGLAYVAGVLENNSIKPGIVDLAVKDISNLKLFELIQRRQYNFLVINSENTVLQTRDFYFALELAKDLKIKFPDLVIVMTGAHVTFRDIETMENNPEIDFVVRYEPEIVLLNLIKTLNDSGDLNRVKGITYRENKEIIKNPDEKPIVDLDSLPFPARHLFPIKEYLKKDKETIVQSARGCTNRCLFCQSSSMDRCLRFRNIDKVIEEIKEVLSLGFDSIFFSDLDFGVKKERVTEFSKKIIDQGIKLKWSCNIRADRLIDSVDTREMLRLMRDSGCYRVFVGFESFSPEILNNIHKMVSPNMLKDSAKILKEYNIALHASFLFGLPGDTEETIKNTVKVAKEINPQMISFNLLTPFPGTALGDEPEKYGIVIDDKQWYSNKFYNERNVSGNTTLTRERLEQLAKWAYGEFLSQ